MQTLASSGDHPDALGVYLNLRLRNGPDDDEFLEDRGELADAENFLPPGEDLAFGLPGSLYPKLGADARFRMAEETSDRAAASFAFRSARTRPIRTARSGRGSRTSPCRRSGGDALRIEVDGEAFLDNLPDPDFRFRFDIKPQIEDGLLTLPPAEHDLDVDLFGEFLIAIASAGWSVRDSAVPASWRWSY